MKYKILVFLVTIFGLVIFVHAMHKLHDNVIKQEINLCLVDEQGHPCITLLQLLSLTNIEHDGSLQSIVEQTQKPQAEWMRKEGSERWDIVDQNIENKDEFFKLFDQLHLVDEISPEHDQYDYMVLMGATYFRIKTRLEHAIKLFKQGIRFDQIVMLGGARPLTESELDALKHDFNLKESDFIPETEAQVMQFMYDRTEMPEGMRKISMILIDAPMKITKTGVLARPTTGDTVNLWMELNPMPGSCLVISNQPYVGYQDSVIKTLLPKVFSVETVGQKSEDAKIGIYLDTLARNLYQEKIRLGL